MRRDGLSELTATAERLAEARPRICWQSFKINSCKSEDYPLKYSHALEALGGTTIEGPVHTVHVLNIPTPQDLDNHPLRGASWEGFAIEDIIRRERLTRPFTQFYFWRTATGQEADLLLDRGNRRIAVEIKANSATNIHDARKLETLLDDIGADAGWLVGLGGESATLTERVRSISLDLHPEWLP